MAAMTSTMSALRLSAKAPNASKASAKVHIVGVPWVLHFVFFIAAFLFLTHREVGGEKGESEKKRRDGKRGGRAKLRSGEWARRPE